MIVSVVERCMTLRLRGGMRVCIRIISYDYVNYTFYSLDVFHH